MIIDACFAIMLLLAMYHGFRKGFIVSIISLIAIVVALVAALKLSQVSAMYMQQWFNIDARYLPLISLIVVFIAALFLMRLAGGLLENIFKAVNLNFLNKAAGGLVWGVILTIVFSIALWYLYSMDLFTDELIVGSVTFEHLIDIAPASMGAIGKVLPFVQEAFHWLETFFENIAQSARVS